jgi:hypothetical protein
MFLTTNRLVASVFFLLLVGAAVFALERVLFADASFILFRIVNSGSLQIQEQRYGSFITQCVPLFASLLGLPLKTIAVLYSLSFQLFYLAVALMLLYRFREKELAVLMSFYFLLFVSDTWFWMNNEVHQGIAWMFLLFGVSSAMRKKKTHSVQQTIIFTLLAFLALYTHPLLVFPTSYLWLFLSSRNNWVYTRKQTIFFSAILLLIAASKLYWSNSAASHYDAEKLQGIKDLSFTAAINALHSPLAIEIVRRTITQYWIVPLLFLSGVIVLAVKKVWGLLLLIISYVLIYLVAICLIFTEFTPFYTESELMPATIFLAAPFVYFILPRVNGRVELVLLSAIFLFRIGAITAAAPKWLTRKEWLFNTLEAMREQSITKAVIRETEASKKLLLLTWGTPTESLLASALQGENPQRTFVVDQAENFSQRMPPDKRTMIGSFEAIPFSALNPYYFRLDTTTGYKVPNLP